MTMREIIARALAPKAWAPIRDGTSPLAQKNRRTASLRHADAVLEAMEPDMDMGIAGAKAINKQMIGPGAPADYHAAIDCFKAMLNAARQPKERRALFDCGQCVNIDGCLNGRALPPKESSDG